MHVLRSPAGGGDDLRPALLLVRIGVATRDWDNWATEESERGLGGSGHYRCGLPAKVLRDMGHDVTLGTLLADTHLGELGVRTWDGEHHWSHDLILLQRWMFADLPERIRRARANGQVVLNDVDDWFEGLDPANRAFQTTHPRMNPTENATHYRKVLAAGNGIVCSTPFLRDRYRRLAPTILVRNRLDLARWKPQEVRDGPPVLGWVGALPWRSSGDLATLRGVLGPFIERHDLTVRHHGCLTPGEFAAALNLDPTRVIEQPMVPIGEHERQFEGIDVCLIPLAMTPFNQAKSALKGLQAAAAGVPFIASPTPEYQWLRGQRVGNTAQKPKNWVWMLERRLGPDARGLDVALNAIGVEGMGLDALAREWGMLVDAVHGGNPSLA